MHAVVHGESTLVDLLEGTRLLRERGATLAGLVQTDVDPRDLALATKRMDRYVVGMPSRLAQVKNA
jgi:hypothetical protein